MSPPFATVDIPVGNLLGKIKVLDEDNSGRELRYLLLCSLCIVFFLFLLVHRPHHDAHHLAIAVLVGIFCAVDDKLRAACLEGQEGTNDGVP